MKGGGKIVGDSWLVRVRTLREGDCIQCSSWSSTGLFWFGGAVLCVAAIEPTGLRDGHLNVWTFERDMPSADRQLCLRADDQVSVASRDMQPMRAADAANKRVVKGEQLNLFGDD